MTQRFDWINTLAVAEAQAELAEVMSEERDWLRRAAALRSKLGSLTESEQRYLEAKTRRTLAKFGREMCA